MMGVYEVGKPFIAGKHKYPEGCVFEFRQEGAFLCFFYDKPTQDEIHRIKGKEVNFAFTVLEGLIIFLCRFSGADWTDSIFNWHLYAEHQKVVPSALPTLASRLFLQIVLVDASTGIIRAIRGVSLSPDFTSKLYGAIVAQSTDIAITSLEQDKRTTIIYRKYPNSKDLLKIAIATCKGGS